jgi:hypothetical protein
MNAMLRRLLRWGSTPRLCKCVLMIDVDASNNKPSTTRDCDLSSLFWQYHYFSPCDTCTQVLEEAMLRVPSPSAQVQEMLTGARLSARRQKAQPGCEAIVPLPGEEGFGDLMRQQMQAMGLGNLPQRSNLTQEQLDAIQPELDLMEETQRGARCEAQGDYSTAVKIYRSQAARGCTTSLAALAALYFLGTYRSRNLTSIVAHNHISHHHSLKHRARQGHF